MEISFFFEKNIRNCLLFEISTKKSMWLIEPLTAGLFEPSVSEISLFREVRRKQISRFFYFSSIMVPKKDENIVR